MKVSINATAVLAVVGVAVVGLVVWKGWGKAVEVVKKDLNPASPDNIVNKGVSAAGAAVTGDRDWTLGGWIYDLTHDDPMAAKQPARPNPSVDVNGLGAGLWD